MLDQNDLLRLDGVEQVEPSFNSSDSGMKLVHSCTVLGSKNAVKVIKVADRAGLNDLVLARLRRELELLNTLSSPYLPTLGSLPVQVVIKASETFIVYSEQFIEGADVSELIAGNGFSEPAKITKLLHDVALAIQTFWSHEQTVHRDIKPANIRYSNVSNNFILIDPGIALIRERTSITPTGGASPRTPKYAVPEVIEARRKSMSFKTDLFALGIVAYEAATGRHPFYAPGMSEQQLNNAILNQKPTELSTLRPDLEPGVAQMIMKMLQKRPHQRPNKIENIIDLGGRQ